MIGTMAGAQVCAAMNNFLVLEYHAHDVAWFGITRWRELVATVRDPAALRPPAVVAVPLTVVAVFGTAIFAVVEAVLLRTLPYEDAGALVTLNHRDLRTGITKEFIAIGDYVDLDDFARYFAVLVWLANHDSLLQNGQNFYTYLHPQTNRMHFIAWDQDFSFGNNWASATNRGPEAAQHDPHARKVEDGKH